MSFLPCYIALPHFEFDCGATTHVVTDNSKFIRFGNDFKPGNHHIEFADGSRTNNIVLKEGILKLL